jgi:hypothetical protein
MLCTGGAGVIGNRGFITGFCHSLKWVSLSTLSSEIKVLTKLSGIAFALQQLEEELERPDMCPMTICTDSRSCTQVTADPGRHRINLTHVDRDAMKACEYVRRGRVAVRWIPTDQNWADIFTKPYWQPKKSTISGSRCAGMSHGRCPTERRRPPELPSLNLSY